MPRFLRGIRLALCIRCLGKSPQMAAEFAHDIAGRPGTPVVGDHRQLPGNDVGEDVHGIVPVCVRD